MRKRILHVYPDARRANMEYRMMVEEISKSVKSTIGKHNTRTILSGDEEHFFYTVKQLENGALQGQIINEYRGEVPHYYKPYLDHLVLRSNSE